MAYATNLGVTRDRLKEATKAAIGLAAKYKLDLQTAFMLIGRASKGQTQMLTRYGIVLGDTLTEQEKFNEILRLGAEAFGLATAEANTLQGSAEQLKNAWGDLKEAIGEGLDIGDSFKSLADGIRILTPAIAKLMWVLKMQTPGAALEEGLRRQQELFDEHYGKFSGGGGGAFGGKGVSGGLGPSPGRTGRPMTQQEMDTMAGFGPGPSGQAKTRNDEMVKDTRQATVDVAAAYRRMYADMDTNTQQYWEARKELLLEEYREYAAVMEDKQLVHKLYLEEAKKLARAEAQAMGGPLEAMKARIEEMQARMPRLGQAFADAAETGINRFSDALADAIVYGKDFKDSMRQIGQEIAHMLAKWAIQKATVGAATAAFGAGMFHGGGTVGAGMQVVRHSPAAAFMGAPRFHDGGEVPAWLQPGERVQSKQQVGATDRVMGRMVALLERIAAKDTSPTVAVLQSEEQILSVMRSRAGEEAIERARGRTEIT
jgi:hypothetical protein